MNINYTKQHHKIETAEVATKCITSEEDNGSGLQNINVTTIT